MDVPIAGSTGSGASDRTLADLYDLLDERYRPEIATRYEKLVVPERVAIKPVHRWFRMKEAYSPALLDQVIEDTGLAERRGLRIFDPFMGSGTTGVSALLSNGLSDCTVGGIEVNPFLHLLASSKMAVLSLGDAERLDLADSISSGVQIVLRSRPGRSPKPPLLNAFNTEEYFPVETLGRLLKMRANWESIGDGVAKDLLGIGLASTLEPCSRLRKDGRALRYEAEKAVEDPHKQFVERMTNIEKDLREVKPSGTGRVTYGSSLSETSWSSFPDSEWDLCTFSPPYPNNIDYTEVYKLEAWFLGLIASTSQFQEQRRKTVRSHPSILFGSRGGMPVPERLSGSIEELDEVLRSAIPSDRYTLQRERVVRGFLEDCGTVLSRAYEALRPGGFLTYVVGNSRHGTGDGQFTVASDVLLAELGTAAGFEFKSLLVARELHRRGKDEHLRESVVLLRKPSG